MKIQKSFSTILLCFILLFTVIMLIVPLICYYLSSASYLSACNSYDDLYAEISEDVMEWKNQGEYYTSFKPNEVSPENIRKVINKKDYILANSVYSCALSWETPRDSWGIYKIKVTYEYYMSKEQRNETKKLCDVMAKELDGKTDYEKIKAVHDYIILNCEYSLSHNGPYNCLFEGKSCCNGYALAFQMMMDSCGIDCEYITGDNHAWNIVYLDGSWYRIDLTWDDGKGETVLYNHFLKNIVE